MRWELKNSSPAFGPDTSGIGYSLNVVPNLVTYVRVAMLVISYVAYRYFSLLESNIVIYTFISEKTKIYLISIKVAGFRACKIGVLVKIAN